jgi:hypothetical protein
VAAWFAAHGLPGATGAEAALLDELCDELGIPPGAASGTISHR